MECCCANSEKHGNLLNRGRKAFGLHYKDYTNTIITLRPKKIKVGAIQFETLVIGTIRNEQLQAIDFASAAGKGVNAVIHSSDFIRDYGYSATVNINKESSFYYPIRRELEKQGIDTDQFHGVFSMNFKPGEDYSFLFDNSVQLASPGAVVLVHRIATVVLPNIMGSSVAVNESGMVLHFSQHGKGKKTLQQEEVDKLNDILKNSSNKKERKAAKEKLKGHNKGTKDRPSRQTKDDKK
ncbi:MAG: hypothetical protein H0X63_09325 [Flavobacteriales bacterium]|nr:hypothetical protein [Flavobacteriales bacterium]